MIESIYPSRGGLTDFYIWKDAPKERIRLNKPISELNDKLWGLYRNGTEAQ